MEKRRSIEVSGVTHVNPIPAACRRGPFVVSGAIGGADPQTGKVPDDLDAQCRQMFENVRRVMSAAGGTPDDIIKMVLEWDQNPNAVRDELLKEPLKLASDGTIKLPERPGLGIELDRAAVERYRVG